MASRDSQSVEHQPWCTEASVRATDDREIDQRASAKTIVEIDLVTSAPFLILNVMSALGVQPSARRPPRPGLDAFGADQRQ